MKNFERILIKLAIIQFVFLLVAQAIILYSPLTPYITRMIEYEGVDKSDTTKTIETLLNNN
ncbi:YpfB family protein [Bacillus sp. REN16]|uniref:YpfB family protein n=1 Tax=Bacillus sp. REN16 TaxID=2887296 RepID=UPI001E3AD8AA|nr:YpfB family protein [Bacillus sp. REN16]MCC3358302.1 YpfB family protein [Bacillus sp. REN16]